MGAFDHLIPKKKGGGVLGTLSDLGKDALGGAIQGTGSGVRGVGEATEMPGVRRLGTALADLGDRVSTSTSQGYREAKQKSSPTGELLSPSTWSLGEDPSLLGYAGQAANVLGQFAPTVAAAVLTKGKVAPTAAVGAAVGGGAAAEQEGERILDMEDADLAKIPRFQELMSGGMTQAQAREALAAETSSSAFRTAAPLGALSAFTEGLPLTGVGQRIVSKVAGDGRIARAVTGGVGGALGEGVQESLENASSIAGANLATGEERSLSEDSFANFALGALGGGIVGAAGGLLQTPDADPVATPEDFAPVAQPTPQATAPQAPIPNPSGPLSRAVNAGAATGLDVTPAPTTTLDPAAQRPAAQPAPAAQAQPPAPQPAVMQPAAEQPQAAQQPEPPRVPPGVDPLTGEVIGADEDRARNAIRVALETRRAIDGKLLAGAFPQIQPERLAQLVQDVRAERNQALKQPPPLALPAPEPAKPEAPDLKLAPTGRPFKTDAAVQAALRFNPGMSAVKVEGGWALKPNPSDSSNSSFRNQVETAADPEKTLAPSAAETRSAMDAAMKVGQHERAKFGFESVGVNAAGQQVYQNSTGARQVRDADGNVIRTRFSPEAATDAQYQTVEESTPAGGAQPANQQKEVIREEEQQVPADVAGNVAGDAGQDGTQGQGEAQGPQALTQAAAPSAPQPAARQKALQRIERGTAYFASREKAEQFIADAGIGDTHEAVQVKPNRLEVRAKQPAVSDAATPAAPAAAAAASRPGESLSKEQRDKLITLFDNAPAGSTVNYDGKVWEKRTATLWGLQGQAAGPQRVSSFFVDSGVRGGPRAPGVQQPKADPAPDANKESQGQRKPPVARVFDNSATNPGEFFVESGEGLGRNIYLARFKLNAVGKPVGIKFFYDADVTRNIASEAIDRFVSERAKRQASPQQSASDVAKVFRDAYLKAHGSDRALPEERYASEASMLSRMVEAKDADALISRNLGDAKANPAARAVFEALTGVKLPKGRGSTERAIDEWAGVTPEERGRRTQARKDEIAERSAREQLPYLRRRAESVRVDGGEKQMNGAEWVDSVIAGGYSNVVMRGPVTYLANAEGRAYKVPNAAMAQYAREAVKRAKQDAPTQQPAQDQGGTAPQGAGSTQPTPAPAPIGRRGDGTLLYEDSRGVRWYRKPGIEGDQVFASSKELTSEFMTEQEALEDALNRFDRQSRETPAPAATPQPSANTVFTEDAAAAARARLKAAFSRLNSGIDPQMMLDGITLAGYHIEKGARSFAAYAKAMVEDLGDAVKPYLKSWYTAVKLDPRAQGFDGMDSLADVEAAPLPGERRSDTATRARVDALPAGERDAEIERLRRQNEELQRQLDTDPLTGVASRAAYERDKPEAKGVAIIDLKLFKGYNSVGGQTFGDEVLRAFGAAMRDAEAQGVRAYRSGGDEFTFLSTADVAAVEAATARLQENAQQISLQLTKDGVSYVVEGIPFTAGFGTDEKSADSDLSSRKGDYDRNALPESIRRVDPASVPPSGEAAPAGGEAGGGDVQGEAGQVEGETNDRTRRNRSGDRTAAARGGAQERPAAAGDNDPSVGVDGREPREAEATGAEQGADASPAGTPGEPGGRGGRDGVDGERDGGRGPADGRDPASTVSSRQNFTITDELDFAGAGEATKYRNNVAAIRLLKQIEGEGRTATAAEQSVLARYVGWGGLPKAFDPRNAEWSERYAELKELLTAQEWADAARSTQDAHYTSKEVVDGMWSMVARLGFDGGRVLEPSMGTGNFFGLMPPALRGASRLTGIELDSITGRIAKQLYPRASIAVKGFNETRIQPDSVDVAIGNPPFGSQSIFDPQYPEESKQSIHNYFFMKSLASLRPGGIMPMVVSNFLMDAQTSTARAWLAERARLVAAFRLPNTAFKSNAGTSVTTDIIILQRLAPGEQGNPEAWVETGTFERDGQAYPLNRWFIDHPEALLGSLEVSTNTTYGRPGLILKPKPDTTLAQELERAVAMLPEGIYVPAGKSVMDAIAEGEVPAEAANARVYGHFVAPDGRIMQRQPDYNGKVTATTLNMEGTTADRLRGMMGIRDTVRALIRAETDPGASEAQLSALRDELNKAYDAFVKKHGYLSRDVNKRLFREDPDGPLLLGLEKGYDRGVSREVAKKSGVEPRKESAAKADIFTRRTNYPVRPTESVKDAKSAMLASLNERGRIDMDFIGRIYKKGKFLTEEDFAAELGDLVYEWGGELIPADAFLSGNVKTKLVMASALAEKMPKYRRHVEALRKVQPPDKNPVDIFVRLGTPWIPMEDYAAFARDTFEGRADGAFLRAIGRWEVRIDSTNRTLSSERWGTDRMTASSIMEALMSNKPIAVYDPGERGTRILNQEATSAAKGKAAELEQEFAEWVWRDPERRERLARYFNDTFNTDVARKFDGSHMTFPGMNRSVLDGGALRPHQSAYVYRAIQDGRALADHVVGAGKTYAAIATVMEMRRLGISRKPMVVVPNHLVDQWAKDFVKLYPGANILAASRKDFQKGNRQRLFSRIATGDWDAVIVAHSSFGFIPLPPEQEQRILEDQVAEIQSAMEILRSDKGKDKLSVKQLQKQKEALEEKLARLAKRPRDQIMEFSEMGVDSLTVDEAHEFKNLFFATSLRGVAGLGDPAGSKKAFDLFVKTRYLMERNGDKGVFFLTGTPVSNTLSEVFHMQRYLQFDQLKERGLHTFDAWAGTFGAIVSDWEMDAAGRFKEKSRFSKFANMKQLTKIWGQVADVVTRQDLMRDAEAQGKRFPLPKIKGGKPENVVAERSTLQANFIGVPQPVLDENGNPRVDPETGVPVEEYAPGTIIHRMDNMPKDPSVDNHLKATNDARKAGLDFRLIDPAAPDFAGSKVNEAARRIVDVWKRNDYRKGTQLVFCDLSVPASARGKATEKAQAKMPTFFTRINGVLTHVDGKPMKLSAMPSGKFFLLKQGREWGVYEANTGLRIASGTSRQDVIDDANAAVASNLATIDATIQSSAIPQEDIEAYIRQWQEDQAQQQEPEGDGEDDAETQEDSVSMDELLADESTFSVYDDMKAKLIAAGIPEDQIAFIHDYETDLQKAALFAKVNRGDIRVLMGSTKKMGAGMNVQRKLVALHHLDAPWRPSDLEQRDGRIIRQGNEFYNEDPEGFEIELYRYSTGQTYDARQWEIIEVKARGIEDFRSGQKDEIEDVTGEAASAADMKGAASGNPLILESVKLRKEVKDLEAQERQHRSAAYAMERKVREIDDGTAYEFRALNRARSIAAAIGPADPFSVVLDGKTYTEKSEIKTTPIMEAFKKALGSPDPVRIGSYRGMDISVRKIGDSLRIAAEVGKEEVGATSFLPDDNLTVSGFFQRLDNIAKKGLEDGVRYAEASLEKAKREAEQARKELTRGFPKAEELARKRERQAAVVKALRSGRRSVDGDPGAEAPATVSAAQMVDKDGNAVTVVRGPYMQGSARLALVKYPDGTQHEVLWSTLNAAPQFSKASKPARSMRPEVLQATYNRITKDWGVPVRVVATAAELPASVRRAPDFDQETVDGVIADGTIYVVADMIATSRQALTVLAHEAYGHFGMEAMLGNQFEGVVRDVEKLRADGRMAELFAEIERRYPGADGATVAREAIAVLAERQERVPVLARAIAALRRFLRGLGFNVDFTEGELRSMIARASRFVQSGRAGAGGAPQFSKRNLISSEENPDEVYKEMAADDDVVLAIESWIVDGTIPSDAMNDRFLSYMRRLPIVHRAAPMNEFTRAQPKGVSPHRRGWSSWTVNGDRTTRHFLDRDGEVIRSRYGRGIDLEELAMWRSRLTGQPHRYGGQGEWLLLDDSTIAESGSFNSRVQFSRRLPGVEAAASVVDDKAADLRPTWLKALTRQQLVAVGRDQFDVDGENLAARYEKLARRMEADAQQELAAPIGEGRRNVSDVTEAWAKMLSPLGRGRAMGAKLANLMHDATLAGIDPSEPPGVDDSAVEYARLKARWKELSPEAQQLYRDVRDAYAQRRKDFYDALVDRIQRSDADGLVKRRMVDQLREQFEAGKVKGPYFPLARFGDYYVVAENADGEREFVMTETQRDQRREAARLRGLGYTVKTGKSMRNLAADMGPGAGFVAEVAALIDKEVGEDAAETLKDGLYQMYLQALPEQSVRKHFIHRKGTPGFSQDALRAFANQMGHGAKQLSRLRYASQLADTLRAMRKAAPDAPDPNKAADIVQALDSSYKWMMNPQNAAWANWATSLGFTWYLGVSPAAALVNLTQLPMVTLPVLSAKHGVAKSAAALTKASADYAGTLSKAKRAKLEGEFGGDMGRMLTELETSGAIDRTMTLSMMGLGEDNAPVAIGAQRVMKTIGYLFHQAERMNREATAIAAYRLARDAGQGHDAAMEYAYETVFESHFDYSSSNRAEFMRGNVAKVLLLFRQYSQNITYYLARNLHQSLRGESKEMRREAAVKLYGMLGMTSVFAGALGMPLVGLAMSVARLMQGMFGDDDEPFEPEAEFRRWLASMVGEDAGRIIAKGAGNELTGLDIASRTGLRDLWVRSPDPQQEGKDLAYHYLEQVAGPVAGIAINAFKGAQLVGEGQLRRGVESMVPKFVKDASKALRFREEGATTLRGDPIVEDFSGWELWNQGFGLTPANLSDQYTRNNALKSAERQVLDRRQSLVNLWAMARKNGDADGIREAMALIRAFNRRWPQKAITPDSLRRSLLSREAFSRRTVGGVAIDEKLRPQLAPMVDY